LAKRSWVLVYLNSIGNLLLTPRYNGVACITYRWRESVAGEGGDRLPGSWTGLAIVPVSSPAIARFDGFPAVEVSVCDGPELG
jgi:hypothetical protein